MVRVNRYVLYIGSLAVHRLDIRCMQRRTRCTGGMLSLNATPRLLNMPAWALRPSACASFCASWLNLKVDLCIEFVSLCVTCVALVVFLSNKPAYLYIYIYVRSRFVRACRTLNVSTVAFFPAIELRAHQIGLYCFSKDILVCIFSWLEVLKKGHHSPVQIYISEVDTKISIFMIYTKLAFASAL